ncbi:MAG: lactate dehydrogenase [Clostridia bacterium]|nr:lactate dehydrogenase [Clostridia bacterium]
MFYYYKYKNNVLFSLHEYRGFSNINEDIARNHAQPLFFLGKLPPSKSRMSFALSDPTMIYLQQENVNLLKYTKLERPLQSWVHEKILKHQVVYINTEYPNWEDALERSTPKKWNINIIALGDIGSTLLIGLRLLSNGAIGKIGLFDKNTVNLERWEFEINQTVPPFNYEGHPEVTIIKEENLTNCDMLVFCAAQGYGIDKKKNNTDVRMAQLEGNSQIISYYAKMLRNSEFKGLFAVLSDPVDLLCKKVYLDSNRDISGHLDYKGLAPEQIRGYGLGVMNARALYYSKKNPKLSHYAAEGRAYGPHGVGLVIADSIENYNEKLSEQLTESALNANMKMRGIGFKPYVAPALSSGAYSILATINGQWHYASTFLGGVFMGANNRLINGYTELEQLNLPENLLKRLRTSFANLEII